MLERKLVFRSFRKTMIQKVSKVLKTKLHQASFRVTQLGTSYYYLSLRETLALLDSEIKVSSHKKGTHWKARERDLPYIYLYQVV